MPAASLISNNEVGRVHQNIKEQTGHDVSKTTIWRTLEEKDALFAAKSLGRCHLREGKFQQLETELVAWASGVLGHHATLTHALIKEQADVFSEQKKNPRA